MSRDDVVAAAAAEQRAAPVGATQAADLADKYEQMLRLADLFDDAGAQMRAWAGLGRDVLTDPDVTATATLSPGTWATAEEELRAATTGKHGLLSRSIELDADALVLRATVLTYRWIDELQAAAYETLGSIAGRAIGYLAPQVSLGGAIVAAGLIETDALDRDGVAAYLGELAEANPELMEHVTTGGGLVDSLQMRGLLTAGVLSGDGGRSARDGGLRAAGIAPLDDGWGAALRDVAAGLAETTAGTTVRSAEPTADPASPTEATVDAPQGLEGLMAILTEEDADPVRILRVRPGRLVAFLDGSDGSDGLGGRGGGGAAPAPGRLRLVTGDPAADGHRAGRGDAAARTVRALAAAAAHDEQPTRVMLVGRGAGGAVAVEIAARGDLPGVVVDQVVTAAAPAAQVRPLPPDVRVLALEDRADPVAVLGSLVNAGAPDRLTVLFDATAADATPDGAAPAGTAPLVAGGRAADRSGHPDLVAALERWRELGYLRTFA